MVFLSASVARCVWRWARISKWSGTQHAVTKQPSMIGLPSLPKTLPTLTSPTNTSTKPPLWEFYLCLSLRGTVPSRSDTTLLQQSQSWQQHRFSMLGQSTPCQLGDSILRKKETGRCKCSIRWCRAVGTPMRGLAYTTFLSVKTMGRQATEAISLTNTCRLAVPFQMTVGSVALCLSPPRLVGTSFVCFLCGASINVWLNALSLCRDMTVFL
eukprot:Lithocolla_globosa_v1_NODE_4589_length_1404_cov_14.862861.p2 type:complete len:212 gc:universal NODE_4589_length_1404_cov_14.862861:341-976(+)